MENDGLLASLVAFEEQAAKAASLLCHLTASDELSVGGLVERIGLSQSALSQHLAKLREEGLVATRKEAQTVYYRICDPRARQVLALLHDLFCPNLGHEPGETTSIGDEQ
jgi:ArsR family transcriptional regulator, virulence genes transcriptional regulator